MTTETTCKSKCKEFVTPIHSKTKRDYLSRVVDFPKAKIATLCKQYGKDYWDGDRKIGYGGYYYDGRWRKAADAMAKEYGLKAGDRILDVGCGKGFLLYDFTQAVPGVEVAGIDISTYAIEYAKEETKPFLQASNATALPFKDKSFDLVVSINTLHNLECFNFYKALKEIERVGRKDKFICVESWRNEQERANLLMWTITCEMYCSTEAWRWWFEHAGYTGDHEFIYFE